jgi:sporulation protein YlmC with PRC-barrel domain
MSETERFQIGSAVLASDGVCGELTRVIIDPIAQALTDLVVAPKHHQALGRLVPVKLVESDGDPIRLRCNIAEFHALDDAEEIHFLPPSGNLFGYGSTAISAWPYYGLGPAGPIGGGIAADGIGLHASPTPAFSDRVPDGEIQVRRGDDVHASDGRIGSVQGLVIDATDHRVTHVLLQEGHLWGRKQVAIPIAAASRVEREIRTTLTKQQIHDLPPVELNSTP